jgi:sialic acid synthase SpsE
MELNLIAKPYIIAEAGTNHNGSVDVALKLVDLAKNAGANSVKFQIINPEGLYIPFIYIDGVSKPNPVIEQRKKFMLTDYEYEKVASYTKELGLDFSASVFDEKSLNLLLKFDPEYIKIASCDLNNISFLKKVAEKATEKKAYIILSTGMSLLDEIEKAISELFNNGFKDIVILHCVSVYPAGLKQMNLAFIDVLKNTFQFPVGLSDHTDNSISAAIALSKGATYFEKHITLDKKQEGFDHAYASEENDFRQYISDIHNVYEALQYNQIKLKDEEINVKKRARRSLYAIRKLEKGEIIEDEDILIVRPEAILNADQVNLILGKRCKKTIMQYQPFSLNLIEE